MDELLKRYFWIVNLAALALCAYLTAATVNNFVAAAIDPDAGTKVRVAAGPATKHTDADKKPGEWRSNPFCKDCTPPTPVAAASAPPPPPSATEPEEEDAGAPPAGSCPERAALVRFARDMLVYEARQKLAGDEEEGGGDRGEPPSLPGVERSGLDVKLVNTVAASAPEWSLATFEEGGELKVYRGRSDELIKGEARLEEILRKHVFLVREGRCEYVALSGEPVKKRRGKKTDKKA